jgi:DnaJ-class molecular chaperone
MDCEAWHEKPHNPRGCPNCHGVGATTELYTSPIIINKVNGNRVPSRTVLRKVLCPVCNGTGEGEVFNGLR